MYIKFYNHKTCFNVVFPQIETMASPQDSWDSLFTCQTQQIKKTGNYVLRTPAIPETQFLIVQTSRV